MNQELREGLAEILEIDTDEVTPDMELGEAWDSLAVVSTIALIDDVYDLMVKPERLADCKTVGEIEQLVETERSSA